MVKDSILNFIASLLPTISRDEIMEDLRVTINELNTIGIPCYVEATTAKRLDGMQSKLSKDIGVRLVSGLKANGIARQTNFLGEVAVRLKNVAVNAELVSKMLDEELESVVVSEGVSSRKAVLIRTAAAMSFVSRYSLDLLNYVYVAELAETKGPHELSAMAPIVRKRIEGQVNYFAAALSDCGIDPKDFAGKLKDLPDLMVNQRNANAVMGAVNLTKFDPFSLTAVMNFSWSPIFHVRLAIAEWQDARYRKNKDLLASLQIQRQMLEDDYQQSPNPQLEKSLRYHTDRIKGLEKRIADYEADLA